MGFTKWSIDISSKHRTLQNKIYPPAKNVQEQTAFWHEVKVVQLGLPTPFYTMNVFQRVGLLLSLKNQAQSRTFDIAHLKNNGGMQGSVWKLCAHLLQESSSSSRRENTKIFKKCAPKKHTFTIASSRRGSKCTLHKWLRLVADRKTRIFDLSRGYSVRQNSCTVLATNQNN